MVGPIWVHRLTTWQFMRSNQIGFPLLVFAPLVNKEDYTARSHIDFILSTLSIFDTPDFQSHGTTF